MKKKNTKRIKTKVEQESNPDSLKKYIAEADLVDLLTQQPGWSILIRDIEEYKDRIVPQLAYLDVNSNSFKEAKILYIVCDRMLKLVEDYAENRKRALEFLEKMENIQTNILMDVDNG